MAADTSVKFYGMWHLVGETVRVSILGMDMGTYTVATDGSVTVTYGADAGGLVTADYLVDNSSSIASVEQNTTFSVVASDGVHSVTVPVVIGVDYTTKGQLLRPDVAVDIKSTQGPGLGKTRRVHMFAVLLQDCVQLKVGSDFTNTLDTQSFTSDTQDTYAEDEPFSGVHVGTIDCVYDFNGQLCWQVDRPYPCTVCSISVWLDYAER